MPILEKLDQPSEARHWTDSIPLEYHYTAGVAGEEFRRELKDSGRFLASKCPKCKTKYLPARMFCPSCFVETKERLTIINPGYVYSYTAVSKDKSGKRPDWPTVLALVKFENVTGGIVHRLEVEDPEKITIGLKVQPVLKDRQDRTGALTDILSFRPIGAGPGRSEREKPSPSESLNELERIRVREILEMIDDSGYPIGEEEVILAPIKNKTGRGERLNRSEDDFLHKLADKAREWGKGEKSSAETEPEYTMAG